MSYSDKEGLLRIGGANFSAIVLSADRTSDAQEVRGCSNGCVFVSWIDAAATDAVVKLQAGMTDAGPWDDISGATKTIGAATGAGRIALTAVGFPYVRAVCTKNSETLAKVTLRYYFTGAR